MLEVADRGPGVPPAMRERVFERFARGAGDSATGGSGLGLAIVRAVAEAHDGQVRAPSTPRAAARASPAAARGPGALRCPTTVLPGLKLPDRRSRS